MLAMIEALTPVVIRHLDALIAEVKQTYSGLDQERALKIADNLVGNLYLAIGSDRMPTAERYWDNPYRTIIEQIDWHLYLDGLHPSGPAQPRNSLVIEQRKEQPEP
jgi:hypothetical protein